MDGNSIEEKKVWNNTFLQKLMICKKLLFVLFLIQRATPTITKSSTCLTLLGSTDHDYHFGEVAFTEDTRQYMDGKRAAEYGNKKEELEVEWEKFVSNGFYRVGKDFMRMV